MNFYQQDDKVNAHNGGICDDSLNDWVEVLSQNNKWIFLSKYKEPPNLNNLFPLKINPRTINDYIKKLSNYIWINLVNKKKIKLMLISWNIYYKSNDRDIWW